MQASLINGGQDLHLHHGPIDLIVSIKGTESSVTRARMLAADRFETVLTNLVAELDVLRQPTAAHCNVADPVAVRMWQATVAFTDDHYITPMAAVAGSVADEILTAITNDVNGLTSVGVNNGGDIALWLADGESTTVGVADPVSGISLARAIISVGDGICGVATSGRHGRSHSLGIADSVTVLAGSAATADAAATLIANAVDLDENPKVHRVAAQELSPDSDLGSRPVTVRVDPLTETECDQALLNGLNLAQTFRQHTCVEAACLVLQDRCIATDYFNSVDQSIDPPNDLQRGAFVNA